MPFSSHLVRQAFRQLQGSSGFAIVAAATLAVAIGATTTVFSVVDGVLLSPLPFPEAEQLVSLRHTAPGLDLEDIPQSDGTYLLYDERNRSFQGIALYREGTVNVVDGEQAVHLASAEVTPGFFEVMGVLPSEGRPFLAEEGRQGGSRVAVVSDRLRRERFQGAPVVGRTLRIEGRSHEVVGVMPSGFAFPRTGTDVWLPLVVEPSEAELGAFGSFGVGRLRDGVDLETAEADLNRLLADLESAFPGSGAAPVLARSGFAARLRPLRDEVVGGVGSLLWILLGAVTFILLIACANVANLLIVHVEGRRREMAIEAALGASRGRLVGGILLESLVLSLVAGASGLLLALVAVRVLVGIEGVALPRLEEVGIDGRVVGFTLLVALLTSVLFGLAPALRLVRADLAGTLRAGGRTLSASRGQRTMRQVLVGTQIMLALVLLTGSGLMMRSFLQLAAVDPGFAPDGVLTFRLALPEAEYPGDEAVANLLERLLERLRSLPEVAAAGVTSALPLAGSADASGHRIAGRDRDPGAPPPVLGVEHVSEDYFRALGIPVLEGRPLEVSDWEQRRPVVVVSRGLAERYWPQEGALGQRLRPASGEEGEDDWYRVVGVVGDIRHRRLTEAPTETIYYPLLRRPEDGWSPRRVGVAVRTTGSPETLAGPVRQAVRELAPRLPVADLQTMESRVSRARARMSLSVALFFVATAVALGLGAVGTYAFVSYLVRQRRREIGIRMAVGAAGGHIRWMIIRESLALAAAGLVAGMALAALLSRSMDALLFEVSARDPVVFLSVPSVLVAVVLLASAMPAQEASHTDPATVLQESE